jgi:hypothetical protein
MAAPLSPARKKEDERRNTGLEEKTKRKKNEN